MVSQSRRRRRAGPAVLAAVAAVGAVLLLATGCTENGTAAASDKASYGRSGPRETVRAAAAALERYGTSRTRTSMSMASGGTRIAVDGEGSFDYRKPAGQLTVRLPEGTSGARPGERRTVTEIVVPKALYMKNRGEGVPAGKWVRVDTTSLADGNLISAGATDPVSAADLLRGARRVTFLGARKVHGETLRRFHGTVDLKVAAREASPRWRAQLAAAADGFSGGVVPFDAQIDGQGRLRKVRHRFTFAGGAPSDLRSRRRSGMTVEYERAKISSKTMLRLRRCRYTATLLLDRLSSRS